MTVKFFGRVIRVTKTETIFTRARAKGVGAGIHAWVDIASQARFVDMGANLLIHKADAIFLSEGLRNEVSELRDLLGQESHSAQTGDVTI